MLNYKDDKLIKDENAVFSVAALSVIGDRSEQQDSFGFFLRQNEGMIAVCDGMGGHKGGKTASELAVKYMLDCYAQYIVIDDRAAFLTDAAKQADSAIFGLKDPLGEPLKAGSTLVCAMIKDKLLTWCSVGDSRAYLLRGGEFVQLTRDHNYLTVLNEKLGAGLITQEQYYDELRRGEALVSYLGIGSLSLIDINEQPFELMSGDKILLMSDGLYKLLDDDEMYRITDNFSNIGEAVMALETKAQKKSKTDFKARDNITVALIKIL